MCGIIPGDGHDADTWVTKARSREESIAETNSRAHAAGFKAYTIVMRLDGGRLRTPVWLEPMGKCELQSMTEAQIKEIFEAHLPQK